VLKLSYEKLLASVLHEILRHKVSVDVAFKRVCRGVCAESLEEREQLYDLTRRFVTDYIKLTCLAGKTLKPSKLVKLWFSNPGLEVGEPYCKLSVPKWLYDKLSSLIGTEEAYELLEAMNNRVWWLRVNLFKSSIEQVTRSLENEGVIFETSREYPYMIKVINTPKPVRLLSVVREFKAIPQDIASAAVVEALNPQQGETIIDACAAPGIKTSLAAMMVEGRIKILALDISSRRITQMKSLMRKLRVPENTIEYRVADSRYIKIDREYDKALIDAPCSNTGAIAKDPSLRVTLKPGKINYYSRIQREILANIAKQVRVIVYATCSLMPEEGEEIVLHITKSHDIGIEKPQVKICNPSYKNYNISDITCRLYPHINESEGFFIAKLAK